MALCLAAGIPVGIAVAIVSAWELALLSAWCVTATAFVVSIWVRLNGADAATTRELATVEDSSRASARSLVVVAATTSLVGVLFGLARASATSRSRSG